MNTLRTTLRRNWLSALCLGLGLGLALLTFRNHAGAQQDAAILPSGLAPDEIRTIEVFETSSPSVVHIQSTALVRRDMFSLNLTRIPAGSGTGFVWDERGHIVTNFHVIQSQLENSGVTLNVILNDQSTWPAKVIGVEPDKDLAVLSIEAPADKLRPLKLGTSSGLRVGQGVLAIGNPFGLDQTLTTGVISGLGREIDSVSGRTIQGVIQTDAAINPGNSGGPLLDSSGRLIGVNTAIFSPSGAYAGVGFAVPADEVSRVVPQLIEHGRVTKPVLGVTLIDDAISRRLSVEGVLIMSIQDGSGAAQAGLRPTTQDERGRVRLGDIIVGADGLKVATAKDLFKTLDRKVIGDTVAMEVLRNRKVVEVTVTLTASR